MIYWRLHYHLVWSTLDRQPLLTAECEKPFYGVLYRKAEELGVKIHAAGNVDDHVHIIASIPPKLAISECVRQLKGASAYAINQLSIKERFQWQAGYAVFSLSEKDLEPAMKYAARQKEHHLDQSLMLEFERLDKD